MLDRRRIIDPECFVEEPGGDETLSDRKRFTAKGKGVKPRIVVLKSPRFQRQLKQPGIADVSEPTSFGVDLASGQARLKDPGNVDGNSQQQRSPATIGGVAEIMTDKLGHGSFH
ncbi:hypothetical protein K0M31_009468 [Melipona bicolor]|uniref:Uncharacterized protein n=1 Tax=Melipona bicolor TaxID=60889 RepID=A0AA40FP33_9HYME|nr:hypothetical protein K0M31_009468 [Melipona bicolor]